MKGPYVLDAQYIKALAEIIEAKREHREPPAAAEPSQPARVPDLMAALNESVVQAKASRGDGEHADVHEPPQPKKTAAQKAPANKASEQKTTTKKTATRKPRRSA